MLLPFLMLNFNKDRFFVSLY